jgi:DNA-binding PucR family transcriptional regulator
MLQYLTGENARAQGRLTSAMALSCQEEHNRLRWAENSERSVLIDFLLHGRLVEQWTVWEAADYLRLPTAGPFVVIAAEVGEVGSEALPQIESKLRGIDLHSAWRLLADLHVGIVHVKTEQHLAKALTSVSRMANTRVGVSPRFDELRETAQAFRYARVALRGRFDPRCPVTLFDGSILGCAAVSAPEVMVKLVTPIIECFAELADDDRETLFETFRVWVANDGSPRAVAELLFCHPNTVRYRLHRIEERTGRSLSHPRDLAELCLAFEVHHRLM